LSRSSELCLCLDDHQARQRPQRRPSGRSFRAGRVLHRSTLSGRLHPHRIDPISDSSPRSPTISANLAIGVTEDTPLRPVSLESIFNAPDASVLLLRPHPPFEVEHLKMHALQRGLAKLPIRHSALIPSVRGSIGAGHKPCPPTAKINLSGGRMIHVICASISRPKTNYIPCRCCERPADAPEVPHR
jgi:hypothetical protein